MDFNMNSFFSEGLLRDYGGRFLWDSVPFHMEEPFMRLGTDAGPQILARNLLQFIHKALRGVEDGSACGPVQSFHTKPKLRLWGLCFVCRCSHVGRQKGLPSTVATKLGA